MRLFGASEHAFWLDAGPGTDRGTSSLGDAGGEERVVAVLSVPGGGSVLVHPEPGRETPLGESPIDVVSRADDPPALGWVGWFGYETAARHMGAPLAESQRADSAMLPVARRVDFDHSARTVRLSARAGPEAEAWMRRTEEELRALVGRAPDEPAPAPRRRPVEPRHTVEQYRRLIERCQASITAGDAYQLCLTNRFETTTDEAPLAVYRRLRRLNPSSLGGFIRAGEHALLSSSPETFLELDRDRLVTTRPIKGTRPRGRTADEDDRLAREVKDDPKERAENLMIVDLMRNDLSRVCELGSVAVTSLFDVEAHPNVFQLVSTVTGRLREDCGLGELLTAAFPAGSMTGAPKRAAMSILHELEGGPRGAYAGAFGSISADGTAQLAMTIRSIVMRGDRASIGSGGGITALSRPDAEIDETHTKIAPLLAALGTTIGDADAHHR
ncbi:aminodeoxychorismate synthase component I [Herbiconiux moechotypicola]|uniref:aminodeoxychorismate synthase component I n=1 Tax=Herbiconiux moechotypicola TaxID=637393 RepID=UPI00217DB6DA|nr:aminodeoxychorismate synthase component I [Herbiconiux moechotypicola]MCS5729368.1 aminodeoxychorismate synthase component I [Herbiconiux moechotypicola]